MRTAALAAVIAATWFAWSGHTDLLLLSFGLVSVIATVVLSRRLGVVDDEGVPLSVVTLGQVTYLPWLMLEVVKSNLDVAGRILRPDPGLDPTMVTVAPETRTAAGAVLLANSITLTPGTVSVRMYDGEILVHALHGDAARTLEEGEMNRRVAAAEVVR